MIFVLPKFRLVRVLLFVEGAMGDPAKVSPRRYHEGHSSRSLFQLLFLLPLVDFFPYGGGIDHYRLFEAHHNLVGALRRRLAI